MTPRTCASAPSDQKVASSLGAAFSTPYATWLAALETFRRPAGLGRWGWLIALAFGCARPPAVEAPAPELPPRLPADARAWYLKARVAEARGDREAADRALAWVLRLDPQDPWAWVHVAEHHLARGAWAEATEHAAGALERAPELAEAHRILGLAAAGAGDEGALPHLERAGELPGVVAARVRLLGDASLLARVGPPETTDEALDRAEAAFAVGAPEVAHALAWPLLEHPVRGPSALELLVRTCRLDEAHGWVKDHPALAADGAWSAALLVLAREASDDALAEAVLRRGDPVTYADWLLARGRTAEVIALLEALPLRSPSAEQRLLVARGEAPPIEPAAGTRRCPGG